MAPSGLCTVTSAQNAANARPGALLRMVFPSPFRSAGRTTCEPPVAKAGIRGAGSCPATVPGARGAVCLLFAYAGLLPSARASPMSAPSEPRAWQSRYACSYPTTRPTRTRIEPGVSTKADELRRRVHSWSAAHSMIDVGGQTIECAVSRQAADPGSALRFAA